MTSLYELLIPLLTADPSLSWPKIVQWHDSIFQELEAGDTTTEWEVIPKSGEIYLVYSQTMGWPVNEDGTKINPTTNAGFYHWQEPNLRRNTNYALGSIINHPEECWIEVEEGSPLKFSFFNSLAFTIYIDITVWMFIIKERDWETVREYLKKPLEQEAP